MADSWIKLYRKLIESQIFSDAQLLRLWIYVLLKANYRPSYFRGVEIGRGQVAFTHRILADHLGCSRGKLGRDLEKLQAIGSIVIKPGREFSVITVCNYELYQCGDSGQRDAGGATNKTAEGAASEAADRAANEATCEAAGGAISEAANRASLKKLRSKEPPPPAHTTSVAACTASDAWTVEEEGLISLGIGNARAVIDAARDCGCTPQDVHAVAAHWPTIAAKFRGVGALVHRLGCLRPGQRPEDPAFWPAAAVDRNAVDHAERARDRQAVADEARRRREEGEERVVNREAEFASLESQGGAKLEQILASVGHETQRLRDLFTRTYGPATGPVELQRFRNTRAAGMAMSRAMKADLLRALLSHESTPAALELA